MSDEPSGYSAAELFQRGEGITYVDFTTMDTIHTTIDKRDINLETYLGQGIYLKTPIIAAPMDTVTNGGLCIALALEGGIGCLHYNYRKPDGSTDIDAQIKEIEDVKRFENGFIEHPVVVGSDYKIAQVIELGEQNKVGNSGIDTFPVTYGGREYGRLVGLLRKQDYSRVKHTNMRVRDRMIPLEKLVTAEMPITLEEANNLLWEKHIRYLPIIDAKGNLQYLLTRGDIDKNEEFPLATKDDKKRLRVLFAVETWPDPAYERFERGFAAGADGCVIDTSQGNTKHEVDMIKHILKNYPDKFIMGGNISTKEAAAILNEAGLHAYRDGQGSGSICTTAGAIGFSRSAASGVYDCAKQGGNAIADGGIKEPGDGFKALACGAKAIMVGNMLAGTLEGPGEVVTHPTKGIPVKTYRGMGSKEANIGGIRGYSRLPQGESGFVDYKGSVHTWVPLIRDGIVSAMEVANCKSIKELHEKMRSGELRFEKRSIGAIMESKIHDLM